MRIDHIVIGADTLHQGVEFIEKQLGVRVPPGGEHNLMGTHNCLMKLGNGIYFEIIAINPKAKSPTRPRWFGLDNPNIRSVLKKQPQLLTWVVSTPDISSLRKTNYPESDSITNMIRGDLEWKITIPKDGSLPDNGLLPSIIEWQTDAHPSKTLPDLGCSLVKLDIHHSDPEWLGAILRSIGTEKLVEMHKLPKVSNSYMIVKIQSPLGLREITSYTDK